MLRLLSLLLLLTALPALAAPPRLTLFITVDALGSDLLLRSKPRLKGGLRQLIDSGAFYPYARYGYAKPRTAPGHTTLATGANPWRHGIVDNRIIDRATGKPERVFPDPAHPVLEAPLSQEDVSPANLMAETFADRLRLSTQEQGKAIALSGKARSAIPLAGRLGQAYWFDETVGKFTTGTWYTKELPVWLKAFNAANPSEAWFSKTWEPLLPRSAYVGEDDRPYEGEQYGLGRVFPHPLTGGLPSPGPQSYTAFAISPLSMELVVKAARAAIEGEGLGKDEVPDVLAVSFSATDRVFHQYGPNSWEMQDTMHRLDKAVGDLVALAERAAGGRANLLVVLSADHGGAAVPEHWAASGVGAERVDPRVLSKGLTEALRAQFGGDVTATIEELDVYLGGKTLEGGKVDGAAVRRAAAAWLVKQPAITLAVASDDLYTTPDVAGLVEPLRRGYYPGRSGDVLFVVKPFHVISTESVGTNHGTPYAYDQLVPLVLAGKGVKPGIYPREISTTDVAPTVAALLEMNLPASAEGEPRHEALVPSR
ncbi:putative AlkP superfamily pyrophosphatase or phosphodiesterase [Archangium gephyra]|uniref:AlkP superfamily pyrophosphatase or phosphodiesterase n=1 Tax=Archangium gephyra TaxID=48 RepID=A0AAC8Q874_9BACT|nr:alkaline phosphatase family protein [Archangium gephyra]AKJ02823.1 Alkaline phosphatase [Archangium gephyra]REG24954.1 putative AlkP superfamily pyrophosphatase or phosphodiesterase [Archangium gephyra]